MKPAKINIAVLTYNALEWTKLCFSSIEANTKVPFHIFVLDNGSTDGTRDWLPTLPAENYTVELSNQNLGVPGGRNRLIEMILPTIPSDGFVVFLDNDMELKPLWAEHYLSFFDDHPEVGIASAHGHRMTVYQNYRELWPVPSATSPVNVACGGFCCWVRAEAIKAVPTFDTQLGIFWHEDDDYTVRLQGVGFQAYALPHVPVVHHEHKSGVATPTVANGGSPKNQMYLAHKWRALGLVGAEGRITERPHSIDRSQPLPLGPGVTGQRISRNQGGFWWLESDALLTFDCSISWRVSAVSLLFQLSDSRHYSKFPVTITVFRNGSPLGEYTFSDASQNHQIDVPLLLSTVNEIRIVTDSKIPPRFLGLASELIEPVALKLASIEFKSATDSVTPPAREAQPVSPSTSIPPDGLAIVSNLYHGDDASILAPVIAQLAEALRIPVRIYPEQVDLRIVQMARPDPTFHYFQNFCLSSVTPRWILHLGTLQDIANQIAEPKPRGFNRENAATIAFITQLESAPSATEASMLSQFQTIWVLSERARQQLPLGLRERCIIMPATAPIRPFPNYAAYLQRATKTIALPIRPRQHLAARAIIFETLKALAGHPDKELVLYSLEDGSDLPIDFINAIVTELRTQQYELPRISLRSHFQQSRHALQFFGECDLTIVPSTDPSAAFFAIELAALGVPWIVTGEHQPIPGFGLTVPYAELCNTVTKILTDADYASSVARSGYDRLSAERRPEQVCAWLQTSLNTAATTTRKPVIETKIVETNTSPRPRYGETRRFEATVGIDARVFSYPECGERGIGNYTYHHLLGLARQKPNWELRLLVEDNDKSDHLASLLSEPNVTLFKFDEYDPSTIDIFHIPDPISLLPGYDSPFRVAPTGIPMSMVFFDLIPLIKNELHLDQWGSTLRLGYMNRLQQIVRSNAEFLAISESTRRDLQTHLKIPAGMTSVISAGYNTPSHMPLLTEEAINSLKQKLGITKPFFMSVGGLDPHKDFATTATAFQHLCRRHQAQFVVVGSMKDPYKQYFQEKFEEAGVRDAVFAGYLPREELVQLYSSSVGLIFPSLYEGFGFPVLEAMANGCPVITTNVSSIPEVAGDACFMVSPRDAQGVLSGMTALLTQPQLRDEHRRRGLIRAKQFTWEKVAERTISVWERMLATSSGARGVTASPRTSNSSASLI